MTAQLVVALSPAQLGVEFRAYPKLVEHSGQRRVQAVVPEQWRRAS